MAYVRRYVPSGIVTEEVLDNIEKAKVPLVKIYHYHVNHLGTPQELSDESGNIIWLSYDRAWGGSFDSLYRQQFVDNWAVKENELQPFKFQGQCLDTETGLHYNRFRYYDSDVGMFISRDPIGLLGGSNVFQYAPNPIGWIDPWGLTEYCAFGGGKEGPPRKPRANKDIDVDEDGMVKSQADEVFPNGASTTIFPSKSPLTGHYHSIPENTVFPDGIAIKRDGKDIIKNSPHAEGHATIFPTRDMPMTEFEELFSNLPWKHAGNKPKKK